jgi:hypothetical protein
MSNGPSELVRGFVTLDEAARIVGVTPEEFRTELAREIVEGGAASDDVRVARALVTRLKNQRPELSTDAPPRPRRTRRRPPAIE